MAEHDPGPGKVVKPLFSAIVLLLLLLVSSGAQAVDVSAKAAVVMDSQTGRILYAKNPELKLLPASTTKLVTAMVTLDHLNPESVVVVSRHAAETPSISPHLRPGQKVLVKDLLYFALMRSINGAAVALAEATAGSEQAFAGLMNQKAAQIGTENTRFVNASGLPAPGQYITAHDLARIMKASLGYPVIRRIISTREKVVDAGGRSYYLRNTNKLLWTDGEVIGGKTGYTRAAHHCLTFAAEKNNTIYVGALLGEPYRDKLWPNAESLLAKSYQVSAGTSEPEIYVNDTNDRPVVLASYVRHHRARRVLHRPGKLRRRYHHIVRHNIVRHRPHRVMTASARKYKRVALHVRHHRHIKKPRHFMARRLHKKRRRVQVARNDAAHNL